MGLIREPLDVDLVINSRPWTEEELKDFRALMKQAKAGKKSKSSKLPASKRAKAQT